MTHVSDSFGFLQGSSVDVRQKQVYQQFSFPLRETYQPAGLYRDTQRSGTDYHRVRRQNGSKSSLHLHDPQSLWGQEQSRLITRVWIGTNCFYLLKVLRVKLINLFISRSWHLWTLEMYLFSYFSFLFEISCYFLQVWLFWMETQHYVSLKIRMLHQINKNVDFNWKRFWKLCPFLPLSSWSGILLHELLGSVKVLLRFWKSSLLWTCRSHLVSTF